MRNNPRDWLIEDIKTIAERYGIEYRQPGTKITIPAHKPIKPVYIKLALIDGLGDINE